MGTCRRLPLSLLPSLIAIITNRYRPEEVEAETQFKKALVVNYYSTQVSQDQ
jgi:hypothetical protein